jgi:hypothetical protein
LKVGAFEIEDIAQVHFSSCLKAVDGTINLSKSVAVVEARSTKPFPQMDSFCLHDANNSSNLLSRCGVLSLAAV